MELASIFIPADRRLALARGLDLPNRTHGAALFMDISGFSALTESLVRVYGPQRGAEELIHHLDQIYDVLIGECDRFGGSTVGFAGDSITCWFDEDDGRRAVTAAAAMQLAMTRFAAIGLPDATSISLAVKVAVACGPVRRFIVGDPRVQLIDTLAGETLNHLAAAERQARPGEIVLDERAAAALDAAVTVKAWRRDKESGDRCAVVDQLVQKADPQPWPALPDDALPEEKVRPWILAPTYERLRRGRGAFLAELRPASAVFFSFGGIDFDGDDASGEKLDAYVRWVQSVLARFEGFLIQLTLGDKGAYMYAAFGAPLAHDDDPRRAVAAATQLRFLPSDLCFISDVRLGITSGMMRAGPYGGSSRRTYGAVSDAVNLAARLMQAAEPGQALASDAIVRTTSSAFHWEALRPLRVKGKSRPVSVATLIGPRARGEIHLPDPSALFPMIGRDAEIQQVLLQIEKATAGQGQIVGVTGEPGCGKSRFLGEVSRIGRERGFTVYGCSCESYGTNHSYLVWQSIFHSFFGVDPSRPLDEQIAGISEQLRAIDPALVARLPLLGVVLGLPIPDNDLTSTFDARLRKTSLEALLVDCLRARAAKLPLMLMLEDCHWIDPISHDLLEAVGRAVADRPVLIVLAYRTPEPPRFPVPRVARLPYFAEVRLDDLTASDAARLIQQKLQHRIGSKVAVSPELIERITTRAQGNPFYIEELLNYLGDQNVNPDDLSAIKASDLPASLQSLILSRLDRMTESQQVTMKAASIVGRSFPLGWLWGVYPDLGDVAEVRSDLDVLSHRELTVPEDPEPDVTYAFKCPVVQEVTYASLLTTSRATLHEQLGNYLEQIYQESTDQNVDLLAFHFDHSGNLPKRRAYLRRAGEAAQAAYANESAIDYYSRVLPLLPEAERAEVTLRLGQVYDVVGNWANADEHYRRGRELAEQFGNRLLAARCAFAIGGLLRRQGHYDDALAWLGRAQHDFEESRDVAGVSQTLTEIGVICRLKGDYAAAQVHYDRSLSRLSEAGSTRDRLILRATTLKEAGIVASLQGDLAKARSLWEEGLSVSRDADDKPGTANLLNNLGILARRQGQYLSARALHAEALALRRQVGDRWAISYSLTNLGNVSHDLSDLAAARSLHEEALTIQRQLGATQDIARSLHNLANVVRDQGEHVSAHDLYVEALTLYLQLGDRWGLAQLLEDLGILTALQAAPVRAAQLVGAGAGIRKSINSPLSESESATLEGRLTAARLALGDPAWAEHYRRGLAMTPDEAVAFATDPNSHLAIRDNT